MKKLILKSCTALALIMGGVISQVALANPYNTEEYHRQWNPQHQGYQHGTTYNGTVIHIPNQEWINYHGALASNDRDSAGISENARSERAAKREALQKCGKKDCRITAYTRNGCLAAAIDERGGGAVGAEGTKQAAEAEAIRICQSDGSTCVINYSHCNHPVRIK